MKPGLFGPEAVEERDEPVRLVAQDRGAALAACRFLEARAVLQRRVLHERGVIMLRRLLLPDVVADGAGMARRIGEVAANSSSARASASPSANPSSRKRIAVSARAAGPSCCGRFQPMKSKVPSAL